MSVKKDIKESIKEILAPYLANNKLKASKATQENIIKDLENMITSLLTE